MVFHLPHSEATHGGRQPEHRSQGSLMQTSLLLPAIRESFRKLDPRVMWRNPVMFVVEVVTILTTVLLIRDIVAGGTHLGFAIQINLWLWFTLLFANFAEAVAEGRGKAQADSLNCPGFTGERFVQ
ncbi:hypothetical protein [Gluconobacter sp.]|uniref:hypothetical protein n=1 Tax=Gluconobacter sp. TaxID=1876758 RepID=UPI0039EB48C5